MTKKLKQTAPGKGPEAEAATNKSHTTNQDYNPETTENEIYEMLLEKPVAFHRVFKIITGNSSAAIFLSQAFYWSKNRAAIKRGGWFIKSSREWEEETGLTRNEQDTARRICKDLGIIEESLRRWNKHATMHFRLNKSRLFSAIRQIPSLRKTSKLIDCGKPANYIDCGKPANYTQRIPIEHSQPRQSGKVFEKWQVTPKEYHPFFEACINPPVALPEPTPKEIKSWLETFDEWTAKRFTTKQISTAGKYAHANSKIVSSPKSLTWILNSNAARANGTKNTQSTSNAKTETVIEQIRKRQKRT